MLEVSHPRNVCGDDREHPRLLPACVFSPDVMVTGSDIGHTGSPHTKSTSTKKKRGRTTPNWKEHFLQRERMNSIPFAHMQKIISSLVAAETVGLTTLSSTVSISYSCYSQRSHYKGQFNQHKNFLSASIERHWAVMDP